MADAVIFDLDGTMWNSAGCASAVWNRVFSRHTEITWEMTSGRAEQLMGKTMDEIGRILFPEFPEEKRNRITEEFGLAEVEYLSENGAVLYDGLEETLKKLAREYGLYIVSNCQDGYVQAFLHAHRLAQYFSDMEMSGRTGLDKGSNIKLIMERNNIQSAVYIGDTETDEKASRIAGIPFIYAAYGFGKALAPDAVISSITELPECVKDIFTVNK